MPFGHGRQNSEITFRCQSGRSAYLYCLGFFGHVVIFCVHFWKFILILQEPIMFATFRKNLSEKLNYD